jgi:hypothetical protein
MGSQAHQGNSNFARLHPKNHQCSTLGKRTSQTTNSTSRYYHECLMNLMLEYLLSPICIIHHSRHHHRRPETSLPTHSPAPAPAPAQHLQPTPVRALITICEGNGHFPSEADTLIGIPEMMRILADHKMERMVTWTPVTPSTATCTV